MPITVSCPSCGTLFNVADRLVGKVVRCSTCSERFSVLDAPERSAPDRDRDRERTRDRRRSRDREEDEEADTPWGLYILGGMGGLAVGFLLVVLVILATSNGTSPGPVAQAPAPANPVVANNDDRQLVQPQPVQPPPEPQPPVEPEGRQPPAEALFAHWAFEEGRGDTAEDLRQRNPGALHDATWGAGLRGRCLELDGLAAYCDLGNSPTLNFKEDEDFAISVWFKTDDTFGTVFLMRNIDDGGPLVGILVEDGRLLGLIRQDRGEDRFPLAIVRGPVVNDKSWHHALLARDIAADRVSLWLDGVSLGTTPARRYGAAGSITTNVRALGCERYRALRNSMSPEWRCLRGSIDEASIYKGVLGDAEARALAAARTTR